MDYLLTKESKTKRSFWIHLVITLGFLVFLLIVVNRLKVVQTSSHIKRVIEKELIQRDDALSSIFKSISQIPISDKAKLFKDRSPELDEIGAMVFLYEGDSLIYWSSNVIDPAEIKDFENQSIVKLNNGWYKITNSIVEHKRFLGALLIKNEFAYHNEYLSRDFFSSLALDAGNSVSIMPGELNIHSTDGTFLFSIQREFPRETKSKQASFLFIVFQLTIVLLLSLIIKFYKSFHSLIKRKWIIPYLVFLDYFIIWLLIRFLQIPSILYESYIYAPTTFADLLHGSIGDLFTNSIFILFAAYTLVSFYQKEDKQLRYSEIRRIFGILSYAIGFLAGFIFYETLIVSLFKNSQISIEFGQGFISNPSISIIAFVIVSCLSLSIFFIGRKTFRYIDDNFSNKSWSYLVGLSILIAYLIVTYFFFELRTISLLLFAVFVLSFLLFSNKSFKLTTIYVVSYLLLFAIYLGFLSSEILISKEKEQRSVIAELIANNRDPMAEYVFESIIEDIYDDPTLTAGIYQMTEGNIETRIIDRIISYFDKQNVKRFVPYITICDTSRLLSIQPENYLINCNEYFASLISESGVATGHPDLFFIKNNSINNSYIINLFFPSTSNHSSKHIYIELVSEFIPEGLGYPELLVDETSDLSGTELINYSFAKYKNGVLIYKFGDYQYSLNLQNYEKLSTDKKSFNNNAYNHILIKKTPEIAFVISKENKDLIETIAPFSYFFIFLTFFLFAFFLITNFSIRIFQVQISFRNRFQFTLLSVILTSFLVIGITTMFYLVHLNETKNNEILSEKAHSVLIELEHKLANEDNLGPDMYETLNDLLVKFSLVFFSDINLYSLDGRLIASSRLQIFDVGLQSSLMNITAFDVIANKEKLLFIQNEKVGNYEYLSAYVPFRNSENKLIAYLNLPYFARQTEIQLEITTFLVALVNIYVLFFVIAVLVTILISRRISKPLQLIRDSIGGIRLGKSNEKIKWSRKDEIGELITEYNRMIDELTQSARLLAKSERESAWREMAKQVAHEIKNPLTPMKLSVQYLKRAWDEDEKDWGKRLDRFTNTIIEQIDSLSEIASAFSDFAKMPIQKSESIDIKQVISNTLELYNDNTDVKFLIHLPEDEYIVRSDKNQMVRVFNNLIKNAIHAIGAKKGGQITISIKKSQYEQIVMIADNGTGIPKEMIDKIFSPSFTTKTGGMGLGLGIVKNIVLNTGGEIWFESEIDKGTAFYISFPHSTRQESVEE
jgi:two-component system, NtrC family, nitrogen regulation sensor histidine kinase NtrY